MNILIHGINYAPEPTGIGKYTAEMASWFAARGHQVSVISAQPHYPAWHSTLGPGENWYRSERIDGVLIHRCPLRLPRRASPTTVDRILLESSFAVSSVPRWLAQGFTKRPDVVVVVVPAFQMCVSALAFGGLVGVPVVIHVQDLQIDAAMRLGMLPDNALTRTLAGLEGSLLRAATQVSTISEGIRQRVISKGVPAEQTFLLPNWASISTSDRLPRDNPVRRSLGLQAEDRLVLYSGSMGEKQGLEIILDAASILREQSRFRFLLVGDGSAKERLMDVARERGLERVSFHDFYPWDQVPELLAASDVNLVVQRREASDLVMPSKLTNILASGRPSVVTADPGTDLYHVVADMGTGVATRPGDPAALADGIRSLGDDAVRIRYGTMARAYARENLDRDTILGRFEAQLDRLRRTGRGTPPTPHVR